MSFDKVNNSGRDIEGHTPTENLDHGFCFACSALFSMSGIRYHQGCWLWSYSHGLMVMRAFMASHACMHDIVMTS